MDPAAALTEQNRLLGQLYATADPGREVPTCPGWTLRNLVTHVGRGDRWAATIVRERAAEYVDIRTVPGGRPPRDGDRDGDRDGIVGWLHDGAAELLAAVATTGADTPVWTFTGPRPAGWWVRRRLHEATVHRADAALAIGADYELPAPLAADGLSEWLDLLAARPVEAGAAPLAEGRTLHLHATDDGLGPAGEWLVRGTGDGLAWEHGHAKGELAVRGRAVELFLAALRRRPTEQARLQLLGDLEIWQTWLARTGF